MMETRFQETGVIIHARLRLDGIVQGLLQFAVFNVETQL